MYGQDGLFIALLNACHELFEIRLPDTAVFVAKRKQFVSSIGPAVTESWMTRLQNATRTASNGAVTACSRRL